MGEVFSVAARHAQSRWRRWRRRKEVAGPRPCAGTSPDPDVETRLRKATRRHAMALGLSTDQAGLLADAVVGALRQALVNRPPTTHRPDRWRGDVAASWPSPRPDLGRRRLRRAVLVVRAGRRAALFSVGGRWQPVLPPESVTLFRFQGRPSAQSASRRPCIYERRVRPRRVRRCLQRPAAIAGWSSSPAARSSWLERWRVVVLRCSTAREAGGGAAGDGAGRQQRFDHPCRGERSDRDAGGPHCVCAGPPVRQAFTTGAARTPSDRGLYRRRWPSRLADGRRFDPIVRHELAHVLARDVTWYPPCAACGSRTRHHRRRGPGCARRERHGGSATLFAEAILLVAATAALAGALLRTKSTRRIATPPRRAPAPLWPSCWPTRPNWDRPRALVRRILASHPPIQPPNLRPARFGAIAPRWSAGNDLHPSGGVGSVAVIVRVPLHRDRPAVFLRRLVAPWWPRPSAVCCWAPD